MIPWIARRLGARARGGAGAAGPQKRFAVDAAAHDWVLCSTRTSARRPSSSAPCAPHFRRRRAFTARFRVPAAQPLPRPLASRTARATDWNVRLFDRRRARWSDDAVHEHVVANGQVARLDGDLLLASAESIDDYVAKQNRYTTLQAEAMHARGERVGLARMALSPIARFLRFYVVKLGFLDGAAGFAHIAIGAFASFLKYAKLRALNARADGTP
jgi:hypothetical protein